MAEEFTPANFYLFVSLSKIVGRQSRAEGAAMISVPFEGAKNTPSMVRIAHEKFVELTLEIVKKKDFNDKTHWDTRSIPLDWESAKAQDMEVNRFYTREELDAMAFKTDHDKRIEVPVDPD